MNQEKKSVLIKYLICFGVASLIAVLVFWRYDFFSDNIAANVQVLGDGFTVAGFALLAYAGMMFISDRGALIGIGFVMRSVVQFFLPMGRKKHEFYGKYRERVLAEKKAKAAKDLSALLVGLLFLTVGIIFNVIFYVNFY